MIKQRMNIMPKNSWNIAVIPGDGIKKQPPKAYVSWRLHKSALIWALTSPTTILHPLIITLPMAK